MLTQHRAGEDQAQLHWMECRLAPGRGALWSAIHWPRLAFCALVRGCIAENRTSTKWWISSNQQPDSRANWRLERWAAMEPLSVKRLVSTRTSGCAVPTVMCSSSSGLWRQSCAVQRVLYCQGTVEQACTVHLSFGWQPWQLLCWGQRSADWGEGAFQPCEPQARFHFAKRKPATSTPFRILQTLYEHPGFLGSAVLSCTPCIWE